MSVAGFQEFWITGSRFYFKKDTPDGGLEQPLIDFGTIRASDPVNPSLDVERVTLLDADGGTQFVADEQVIRNTETYDLTFSNMSLNVLQFLFLSDGVTAFTQTATQANVAHYIAGDDTLQKIEDATGEFLYNIRIEGVVSALADLSVATVTDVDASTKEITVSTDLTTHLTPGEAIVLRATGLVNVENARSYTVASVTATDVTVVEDLAADETSVTGELVYQASGDSGTVYEQSESADADWYPYSHERGIIQVPNGTSITTPATVEVLYTPIALTGNRLLLPQTVGGNVRGTGFIVWGRDSNTRQSVREATVTLTPSAANFSAEDYSNFVLQGTVISDVLLSQPAGRLLYFKGTPTDDTQGPA